MKHAIALVALAISGISGCALDPDTDSIFGTKYDRFVDRMYDCANGKHYPRSDIDKDWGGCLSFYLDEYLYDAPKALNGDRIYIVPIKQGYKLQMPQGGFVGDGATTLLDNWIVIRAQPSAARMIATLEHELDHQRGKRHPNDTTGPIRDERAERMMAERAGNLERAGMRDYLR